MKIGLLTIHDTPSFGGTLQGFALWKYLEDQGYDCEIIDLHRPSAHVDYVSSMRFKPLRQKRKDVKHKIKAILRSLYERILCRNIRYRNGQKEKYDEFNSAIKFSKPYRSIDQLYANPPEYDVYIAGSDQLWNPDQPYCIEPYLLTFVTDKTKKKISFATSIGINYLTEQEKNLFKCGLDDFNSISVRENQAKILLESFVNRKVEKVCDPTFLIDRDYWLSLASPAIEDKPYILLFTLKLHKNLLDYCIKLSEQNGLGLVFLINKSLPQNELYKTVSNAGPQEFLRYIANASLVITDSFHGTVFSIILQTSNFFTYIAPNDKRGSRITDLLTVFGLKNHLLTNTPRFDELNQIKPDYDRTVEIIKEERARAKEYLSSVLV